MSRTVLPGTVLLDSEAVHALGSPHHPKHRRVVSHVQVVADRRRQAVPVSIAVPTTVRVEAGWDRTAPAWAFANRLRIADLPLDAGHGNVAAAIRHRTGVSVADAHLGAVIGSAGPGRVTVVTSDPGDVRSVAGDRDVTVVAI